MRWRGGFWTYEGCRSIGKVGDVPVPEWWAPVQTVRALTRLGVLRRSNELATEWNDPRVLVLPGVVDMRGGLL